LVVPEEFKDRLERVKERIEYAARAAGRDPGEIRLIAATKTVSVERLRNAAAYGCHTFGENRVQEAVAKMDAVAEMPGLEWHFLGPLQSNKIKLIVGRFSLLHAIDRIEVAEYLDRVLRDRDMLQPVLLEVNISAEPSKHGISPDALRDLDHKI
jgi:pyridoxal phosphate enzyme (YggS family)